MILRVAEALLAEEAWPIGAGVRDIAMGFERAERILGERIAEAESKEGVEFQRERRGRIRERRQAWEAGHVSEVEILS